MNNISTLFAAIVAVVLLTVVPSYRLYWIIDQHVFNYVNVETQRFSNSIRHDGYINKDMYEGFVHSLAKTQNVYDIQINHVKKVYYPLQPTDPGYSIDHTFEVIEEDFPTQYILDGIYSSPSGEYRLRQGDSIIVSVENLTTTGSAIFMTFMGGNAASSFIFSRFGGMVTNEDY